MMNKKQLQQIQDVSQLLSNSNLTAGLNNSNFSNKKTTQSKSNIPQADAIIHLLHRTSYGFSQSDIDLANELGFDNYLEYQLDAFAIDTSWLEDILNDILPSLQMSYQEIFIEARENDDFFPGFEIIAASLLRATYSPRQLHELMVEFWSNHFNVNVFDGAVLYLKTVDDRENIRPFALETFRDLLFANAKSPAMLYYLDGYSNTVQGPNENYARELMELHTLGVGGGYTESDVKEVARCFTGWSITDETEDVFIFIPELHDSDSKVVLGQTIPAGGGIEDGEMVLDILANHQSTANFIAFKLCRRFISDNPPQTIIDQVAATYQSTSGNIKDMLRTLFDSQEFAESQDLKFKRPVEFLTSLVRTLQPVDASKIFELIYYNIDKLNQVPFTYHAPTGFSDVSDTWLNSNALLDRWNLGFAIGYGDIPLIRTIGNNNSNETPVAADFLQVPVLQMLDTARTAAEITDRMIDQVLHRPINIEDRNTLIDFAANGQAATAKLPLDQALASARSILAALLASRYFQQR